MTFDKSLIKEVLNLLLSNQDHRTTVIQIVNTGFLAYILEYMKLMHAAKQQCREDDLDWYKNEFVINNHINVDDIIIYSGTNRKTITNHFGNQRRDTLKRGSLEHYESLTATIKDLISEIDGSIDVNICINFEDQTVNLNIIESLIALSSIAAKRLAYQGGAWSTLGKQLETPLMLALCKLYGVNKNNYRIKDNDREVELSDSLFTREVDFFLVAADREYNCEVKLMGKGNPESADAAIARASDVFIADSLSDTNCKQLDSRHVHWIALKSDSGFRKFPQILDALSIKYTYTDFDIHRIRQVIREL